MPVTASLSQDARMAGTWQMVRSSGWAPLPSMAATLLDHLVSSVRVDFLTAWMELLEEPGYLAAVPAGAGEN